ncbi:hypothetical protein H6G93_30460, partial [Nostoc sp. FACHB-973]|nr:hypothetical protein [Nostoc sp. FACHB-973]
SPTFTPHIDWGEAIDVSRFYGRSTELEILSKWIVGGKGEIRLFNACQLSLNCKKISLVEKVGKKSGFFGRFT